MYLNLLKQHVIDNKYTRWYIEIINNSKARTLNGYVEKHHILPKSFKLGGERDKENIAILTAREHFICHRLLIKMMIDKTQKMKMQKASWLLYKMIHKKTGRSYEEVRMHFVGLNTETQKLLWQDPAYREKQRISRAASYADPARQEKHSQDIKQLMQDPSYKEKCVRPMIDAHKTIDHSTDEWVLRSFGSVESREKSASASRTQEARENARQRELSKGSDVLSEGGKSRNRKAVENGILKYGSEEAFRKHHAELIKGRKKYINKTTNEKRMFKPDSVPDGFELITKHCQ